MGSPHVKEERWCLHGGLIPKVLMCQSQSQTAVSSDGPPNNPSPISTFKAMAFRIVPTPQ